MLKSIQWDIYTIAMIALVPTLLLIAGGITWWDEQRLHRVQCELAVDWLEENSRISGQFEQAGTMERTSYWQREFEEVNSPAAAGQLRWGIIQSANYTREYYPDRETGERAMLNPINGLFSRDIIEGTEELVEHCPDTQSMLPAAFPMIFREGEPQ